ncbi:MAG: hypothetical protein M3R37_10380 [Actinomycetota bacterium]|nr:hypothetical protein [Actinomycetota bacterium]
MIGAVGLVVLAVSAGAGARSEATRIQIAATMVAGDEVPTPKGDVGSARGSFTATLTKSDTGAVLNWQLSFGNLTGLTRRDSNGPGPTVRARPCCTERADLRDRVCA